MTKHLWCLLAIGLFLSFLSFKRVIYKRSKTYVYEAVYIYPNGDTLSKEKIVLQPLGRPWIWQWSQTAYKVNYYPDTLNIIDWVYPVNRLRQMSETAKAKRLEEGKEWYGFWQLKSHSGAFEKKDEVWTHPFRSNQYVYTEVAPFPEVDRTKLFADSSWYGKLYLGWDNWAGSIDYTFKVIGEKAYAYKSVKLDNCWEIHSTGVHSSIGTSTNNYLFNEKYGFVELKYTFYNGTRIDFRLVEVIDKREK